ncbi:MAG: tetratricopeptide repeat protein [Saprospiraceae bacterium]|nr:tetratricopeptide repeat protein [Saprospiraceae bacterium]
MERKIEFIIKIYVLLALVLLTSGSVECQTTHDLLKAGDANYKAEDFQQAEIYYRKADNQNAKYSSKFNLGNSIYKQGRYEESVEFYDASTSKAKTAEEVSNAYYNKGNALFEQQQFYKAVDAYKEAIKTNPSNKKAQYNLAVTKEIIKQIQQQQQEQEQNQEENEENSENQDKENQNNEEQQSGESEQNNEEQQEQDSEKQDSSIQNQNSFDSTRLEKQSLDSLDAAKLLQIIQSEEQKVQEKMRKFNSNRKKQEKDW